MSFQGLDFKTSPQRRQTSAKRRDFKLPKSPGTPLKILLASSLVVLAGFSATNWQPSAKAADSTPKSPRLHYSLEIPEPSQSIEVAMLPSQPEPEVEDEWLTVIIKSGDTLASIFSKHGVSSRTVHEIATLNEQTKNLRFIKPGQKIELLIEDEQLRKFKYSPDVTKTLLVKRNEDQSFSSQIVNFELDAFPAYREGVIKTSLFEAAAEANIPEDVIMDMASIFGWDIDFSLDIREGDRFAIVYEELFKGETKIRNGQILAAEFINNGRVYRAAYYTDPTGNSDYFDEEGKSMRKAFLRSPVEFSRISSRFTSRRFHPVLGTWRSHKGVDYAARTGTPVKSSGDGKVIHVGKKGGYGKTIIIRHGGRYTTLYGHLNGYARGVRTGKKVKQGQIIGYVGKTGLATGPHLHYEFRVNGVHRNPLTVKLPEAKPVNPDYLKHFRKETQAHLAMLRLMESQLAANSN